MIELGKVEPVYETFQGWKKDISSVQEYNDLPSEAKAYLEAIESILKVPVSWIGVGASREQMVLKQ